MNPADDPADRPSWVDAIDNPYLHGIYTPTPRETSAQDLEVVGDLPTDLYGAYVRNGPNPQYPPGGLYHWFDGDGMLHSVTFRDGRAGYRSRWIETADLAHDRAAGRPRFPGLMGAGADETLEPRLKDSGNTDVLWHGGNLLALWYLAGDAWRIDPLTLETLGREDFGGKLRTTISAHPKLDERTGDLVWFDYSDEPPYLTTGVVSRDGHLVHEVPIDLPGPRSPHDITITEHYTILHDFPYFQDAELQQRTGRRVVRFHPDVPSRFGVMPRFGGTDDVRWFEFEPGYVLHMVNAWEEGDWIVMDGCRQPDPTIRRRAEEGPLGAMLGYFRARFHLHRWRLNLVTGEAREEPLDDLNVEFPLPDTERYGEKTRYSYHQYIPEDGYTLAFHALVKYDHEDGSRTRYDYGPGWYGSESPFAPRAGGRQAAPRNDRDEDDGYVLSLVTNAETHESQCWVFSARDIAAGPIARVKLPVRVPAGFHAKWIAGDRIWPGAV